MARWIESMPFFPEQLGFPRVDIWNSEEKHASRLQKMCYTLESLGEIRQVFHNEVHRNKVYFGLEFGEQ